MYRWTKAAFPILALLISAVVTFPTPALAHKTHSYDVSVSGAVTDLNAPFTTDGSHKGTRFAGYPIIVTLSFAAGLPDDHPRFACSTPGNEKLDGSDKWEFRGMGIQKGEVGISFRIQVSCELGGKFGSVDVIKLGIVFTDPTANGGPGTYTSTDARITLSHLAEKSLDQPGPPSTTHQSNAKGVEDHDPFFSASGFSMTVTVVDVTP